MPNLQLFALDSRRGLRGGYGSIIGRGYAKKVRLHLKISGRTYLLVIQGLIVQVWSLRKGCSHNPHSGLHPFFHTVVVTTLLSSSSSSTFLMLDS